MSTKKLSIKPLNSQDININLTDKQISIISSAIEIFSQKGYAATTTSEIARKANVAEGTIFHYYKTKKDLLMAIPEYLFKLTFTQVFVQNVINFAENSSDSFEDFLRIIIEDRRKFASTNISLIKVLFQEMPFHPELRMKVTQILAFPMSKIAMVIDKFKAKGKIIDIPSTSIVNLIFTSIFGYFFIHYVAMLELKWDEQETEFLVQYIMNGICTNNPPILPIEGASRETSKS